ncbi:hypothetical protein V5G99_06120 [Bibersteinia trehalosi]|nr:hypothetical protein [Bibersteinia trehalosi]
MNTLICEKMEKTDRLMLTSGLFLRKNAKSCKTFVAHPQIA